MNDQLSYIELLEEDVGSIVLELILIINYRTFVTINIYY